MLLRSLYDIQCPSLSQLFTGQVQSIDCQAQAAPQVCLLGDKSTSMDCWKTGQEMASRRTRLPHSLRPEFDPRTHIKLSGFHTGFACQSQNTAHKHDHDFKRCEKNNFLLPARVAAHSVSLPHHSSPEGSKPQEDGQTPCPTRAKAHHGSGH